MRGCVVIQIWEFFAAVGIIPYHKVRFSSNSLTVWFGQLIMLCWFGSLSPKIGFEFGVFGSGSVDSYL